MRRLALLLALAGCPGPGPRAPVTSTPRAPRARPTATAPPSLRDAAAAALPPLVASRDLDGALVGAAAQPTLVVVFASWCVHCHEQLDRLATLRAAHPEVRILGVNYRGHEEYDHLGSAAAVRAFVAAHAPWLRVVPADDALFAALGAPPKVPTVYVFADDGHLIEVFDRRARPAPTNPELEAALGLTPAP
jgi:thiol-disulfide isomerase/thioredoxin